MRKAPKGGLNPTDNIEIQELFGGFCTDLRVILLIDFQNICYYSSHNYVIQIRVRPIERVALTTGKQSMIET